MSARSTATLEWFGTSTFRVRVNDLDLFFDAYLDRLPGLPPVGLSTTAVEQADFIFVSHAHFDHICGVDVVAMRTGATVVATPESARVLRAVGVPDAQLLVVTGGETVDCGRGTHVRVLPALHACLFARSGADAGTECLGDLGMSAQQRAAKVAGLFDSMEYLPDPAGPALRAMLERSSTHDGGQLAFLLRTESGSVLVSGSAGYWRGIFKGLRPDVALLSVAGRPSLDGEPYQGSVAQFIAQQAGDLGAASVAVCHHDALIPGFPGVDIEPVAGALRTLGSSINYFGMEYAAPVPILR
jgi:L-ascorbate metabolism protein UlaG (beta-lactamase superfamily)